MRAVGHGDEEQASENQEAADDLFSRMDRFSIRLGDEKRTEADTTERMDAIKRGENISTHTINELCRILKCDVCDILRYQDDDK